MPARDDEDDGRQRQLAVLEHERLDVAGKMMHGDERQSRRRRGRLRERHADEQRSHETGTLRHGNRAESRHALASSASARSTAPQMSRMCWRDASSGTTPPHSRWMATCDATTFERIAHGRATLRSPRRQLPRFRHRKFRCRGSALHESSATHDSESEARDLRRSCRRSGASRGLAATRGPTAFRERRFSDSVYGGRKMPRSVMMPAMKRCGVMSNAGFHISAPVGSELTCRRHASLRARCALQSECARPSGVSRSIVERGAAT